MRPEEVLAYAQLLGQGVQGGLQAAISGQRNKLIQAQLEIRKRQLEESLALQKEGMAFQREKFQEAKREFGVETSLKEKSLALQEKALAIKAGALSDPLALAAKRFGLSEAEKAKLKAFSSIYGKWTKATGQKDLVKFANTPIGYKELQQAASNNAALAALLSLPGMEGLKNKKVPIPLGSLFGSMSKLLNYYQAAKWLGLIEGDVNININPPQETAPSPAKPTKTTGKKEVRSTPKAMTPILRFSPKESDRIRKAALRGKEKLLQRKVGKKPRKKAAVPGPKDYEYLKKYAPKWR